MLELTDDEREIRDDVNRSVWTSHETMIGWWQNLQTGEPLQFDYRQQLKEFIDNDTPMAPRRNIGELLCLIHSEISEAMEGARKGLMDDKLPRRCMLEVELADAVIRIFDMAGGLNLDLGGAVAEKLAYNRQRADHRPENRLAPGGKAF